MTVEQSIEETQIMYFVFDIMNSLRKASINGALHGIEWRALKISLRITLNILHCAVEVVADRIIIEMLAMLNYLSESWAPINGEQFKSLLILIFNSLRDVIHNPNIAPILQSKYEALVFAIMHFFIDKRWAYKGGSMISEQVLFVLHSLNGVDSCADINIIFKLLDVSFNEANQISFELTEEDGNEDMDGDGDLMMADNNNNDNNDKLNISTQNSMNQYNNASSGSSSSSGNSSSKKKLLSDTVLRHVPSDDDDEKTLIHDDRGEGTDVVVADGKNKDLLLDFINGSDLDISHTTTSATTFTTTPSTAAMKDSSILIDCTLTSDVLLSTNLIIPSSSSSIPTSTAQLTDKKDDLIDYNNNDNNSNNNSPNTHNSTMSMEGNTLLLLDKGKDQQVMFLQWYKIRQGISTERVDTERARLARCMDKLDLISDATKKFWMKARRKVESELFCESHVCQWKLGVAHVSVRYIYIYIYLDHYNYYNQSYFCYFIIIVIIVMSCT